MNNQELILKFIILLLIVLIAFIIFKRYIYYINKPIEEFNNNTNENTNENNIVNTKNTNNENNYENNVFIYWVGNEYKLIKILRKLMYYHSNSNNGNNSKNYKIHLINDKNIDEYLTDIPEVFYKLQPAHQADYVRVNVIYKYGGLWLDSDTIVMNNLSELFDILKEKDGFFIKEYNSILNGVFGSKKDTPIFKYWKEKVDNILKNNKDGKLRWTELGSEILIDIRDNNNKLYNNYTIFSGKDDMYPFEWDLSVKEYIEKPYDNYKNIEREFQPLIILVNAVYKAVEDKSIEEIVNGKMPINYFINKSLETAGKTKKDLLDDLLSK
jgi:hypothetical protein